MEIYQPVKLAFKLFQPKDEDIGKTPIVMMHGLTSCKELWDDIPQVIADKSRRKVYSLDARNHGDSPWSSEFTMNHNPVDILHFLDTIGIQKAILIGHSMGGDAAMRAALKSPQKVEAIIVEDMKVYRPEELTTDYFKSRMSLLMRLLYLAIRAIEAVPAGVDKDSAEKTMLENILNAIPDEAKSMILPTKRFGIKQTAEGKWVYKANYAAIIEKLKNYTVIPDFNLSGRFDGPSIFIYGTKSHLKIQNNADLIRKFFSEAEFVPIEGATHQVHAEKPKEFTDQVLKFLLRFD